MLESLFNKVAGFQAITEYCNFRILQNFEKTYFEEHLRTAASSFS